MHVLYILSSLFSLWMLYDAMQRRVPCMWYAIILVPMGEFAYFFAVKIHDFDLSPTFSRPPSLDEVRYRFESTPSIENQVELARALYAEGAYAEAASLCEGALRRDDDYAHAHYGLARSRLLLGDLPAAESGLRRVLELDRAYDDYGAWRDLAQVLIQQGRFDEAVEQLERLVRASPRIAHSVALARALQTAGRRHEAAEALQSALRDLEHAPKHVQKLGRPYRAEAHELLGQLA